MESKKEQPSFEEALAKLESIVESMESGEVPLADLIARFEQGTKLLQVCETRL
ncbi:MAG: exodeoxyribonuclease VII small subunit, partial [Opitutaceae bacterium]